MSEYIRYFWSQFKQAVEEHKRAVVFLSFLPLAAVVEMAGFHVPALLAIGIGSLAALSTKK